MTASASRPAPDHYRIRVAGRLDARWSPWFEGLTLAGEEDGTTISGPVADQAALHGLLAKIRDLGLALISVEAVFPPVHPDPRSTSGG